MQVVTCLIRSVNTALGLQTYNIAILSSKDDLLPDLKKEFNKTQVVYYQDLGGIDEGNDIM